MEVQYSLIAAYSTGIILLYILGRLLLVPMKYILKFIFNAFIGGAALLVINMIGSMFKFQIALNVVSALVVGFLGVPGVVLLVILKNIL